MFRLTVFLLVIEGVMSHINVAKLRNKRYLVYPDGGPARAQFILGLGIPVDLKEQAVTVGAVLKFQYDLPTNSTEYTSRIYGFTNTVSRDMNDDSKSYNNDENIVDVDDWSKDVEKLDDNNVEENLILDNDFSNNTETRVKRYLQYAEGGIINSNVVNNDETKLTLEEAIRRQEIIDEQDDEPPKRANRWDYYKILEQMIERYGLSGRPCMLRTICEAAEVPFTHHSGLLAEIGHVLFTPSTTKDELSHHSDNEYHAAETLGREIGVSCEMLFPECEASILDTFTQIGKHTLEQFGLY